MPSSSTNNNGDDDCIRESMQSNVFIKTPAHEFFIFNVKRPDLYPKAFPAVYKCVRVLQGKAGREGFVFESEFAEGRIIRERVSAINYKKKYVVLEQIGGHLFEDYKSLRLILQCIPKCEGSIAQWTIEYVKKKPDDLDPIELYTTIVNSAALADADDYIQKNKNP